MVAAMSSFTLASENFVLDYKSDNKDRQTRMQNVVPVGLDDITAVVETARPSSADGAGRTYLMVAGGNGLAVQSGDPKYFDDGERFQLTVRLYQGYRNPKQRGEEVTEQYEIKLTHALQRQRYVGTFGIHAQCGSATTSGALALKTERGNIAGVMNDFPDLVITGPVEIQAIAQAKGKETPVFQVEGLGFSVEQRNNMLGFIF
jgi:hypothetical protein